MKKPKIPSSVKKRKTIMDPADSFVISNWTDWTDVIIKLMNENT